MHRTVIAAAAALLVLAAGCSADTGSSEGATTPSGTSAPSGSGTFPVTIDTALGEVTVEKQPQRIVSLSPSATESLFAIGAGPQVVAADEYSTYPPEAPKTDLSGFEPNVEAIAGYNPDLVVIASDSNGLSGSLKDLGIPVLLSEEPTTLEEGYDGIAALGQATGQVNGTAKVVAAMRDDIATAMAKAPNAPIRIYHELDNQYFSASSHSFIGSVYKDMGAVNIADEADTSNTGYPQLTEEAIIAADPQLIVITDQVDYTAEDVATRPGWAEVTAVKTGTIVTVDADIASRWGPRLPQMVSEIAEAMTKATNTTAPASAG